MTDLVPIASAPTLADANPALLDQLNRALMLLEDNLPLLVGNPEAQVQIHTRLSDTVKQVGVVTDKVERMLLDECPQRVNRAGRLVYDRLELDGVGVVEPIDRGGRWTDVEYGRMLTDVVTAQYAAGELDGPASTVALISELVSFSGIRSDKRKGTGLAKFGRDRAEYATYIEGTPGVRVLPASGAYGQITGDAA